ncbi:START-like domain [Phytophthora cinnamomi]|uniref:START-like domain n=1 Tax=Phytophthora cinnamomi TaxID=4785 RepID=UPI00355959A9|nr:START-like domain [Phytophthora cinnamomi]
MASDVCQPPISSGLVSTFTLEMDDEDVRAERQSLNDVTAARLRRYHQQSDRRLHATLQLFRERQERERRSRLRLSRSPLPPELPRAVAAGRLAAVETRQWKLLRESSDIRVCC